MSYALPLLGTRSRVPVGDWCCTALRPLGPPLAGVQELVLHARVPRWCMSEGARGCPTWPLAQQCLTPLPKAACVFGFVCVCVWRAAGGGGGGGMSCGSFASRMSAYEMTPDATQYIRILL